jgi:hypothetical protein
MGDVAETAILEIAASKRRQETGETVDLIRWTSESTRHPARDRQTPGNRAVWRASS